jgi:UDP-glucose 4-epimerase
MITVLITGIAGHIGSALARWILDKVPDCRIVGIDDLSCGYRENIPRNSQLATPNSQLPNDTRITWHRVSLGDGLRQSDLAAVSADARPDYVFHLAAYAAEGLSPFCRLYNYRSNLLATAEVLNAILEMGTVKRLVYTSSIAVYGRGSPPFGEGAACRPIDPYGVAKLACEQDIRIAGEQHGLDWCILRPHNVYGPGQSLWQKYRNVLGIWMAQHLQGKPLTIFGDGSQRRAFSFIYDCLPAIWRAAIEPTASRQTINLGGIEPITIWQVARQLAEVMDEKGEVRLEILPTRHEVAAAWCTAGKSRQFLGYEDRTPLAAGLAAMWQWARDAWHRYPERRGSHERIPIELRRGLYGAWRE